MNSRPTYRSLEKDPNYEHAVDETVRRRVGRRDLNRVAAETSTAIVKALGQRRKLWFEYERAADQLRAKREAAYYDLGVEHGIAACAAHGLGRPSKTVRAIAEHLVQEVLRTGVTQQDAVGAAIVAAWAMLGRKIDATTTR